MSAHHVTCLVSTPFQLLATREYLCKTKTPLSASRIIACPSVHNASRLDHLLKVLKIQPSHFILRRYFRNVSHKLTDAARFAFMAPDIARAERVTVALPTSHLDHWAAGLFASRRDRDVVLVDDGTRTISLVDSLREPHPPPESVLQQARNFLLDRPAPPTFISTVFSVFPLEPVPGVRIEQNLLDQLASETIPTHNAANIFLSQPVLEWRRIGAAKEREYLTRLSQQARSSRDRWIYVAHPAETRQNAARRAKELEMELAFPDVPIEAWCAWNIGAPRRVATIFSTAAFTLQILFRHRSTVEMWDTTDLFHPQYRSGVHDIFRYANSLGIDIVKTSA